MTPFIKDMTRTYDYAMCNTLYRTLRIPFLPDTFLCIYLNQLYHIVAVLIPIILLRRKSHVGILTIEDCVH